MKIFISHSSANKQYGEALVELLRGVGINENEIIFSSNTAYGIPTGQNIFNWLKSQINEKPFVIYLLSPDYYASIACLNEMGAAWIVENEHTMLFLPNFDLNSKEFRSGAIDPREIGFFINDEERILMFIDQLSNHFTISKSSVIINQKVRRYLQEIKSFENLNNAPKANPISQQVSTPKVVPIPKDHRETTSDKATPQEVIVKKKTVNIVDNSLSKFTNDILAKKLKDEELLLLHYIIETGKAKLMIGWQTQNEIENIKNWEEIQELNNHLSRNYETAIRKFELRNYTEVSAVTSSDNPKEVKLRPEILANIIDLPKEVKDIIDEAVTRNPFIESKSSWDVDYNF